MNSVIEHRCNSTLFERLSGALLRGPRFLSWFAALIVLLATCTSLSAQVVFDSASSGAIRPNTAGNFTLTFAHTTTATGANLLMVVGVSMNITANTGATVTGITYKGVALKKLGVEMDATPTERVEIWYLLAPATGSNNVVVTVNLPNAARVGVTAGALTFSGVDQTQPLSTMVSNAGTAGTYSQLDIPSGTNQIVFDTLAATEAETVTKGPAATTTQQWNITSGGASADDVRGFGSTNTGAASVPMSETFSGTSNWAEAGASVNPLQADVGVTINPGGAVPLGTNLTYTITVTNYGPTTATNVSLTDTLATGLTVVSATPTQGTCSGAGVSPVTCALGSLTGGSTATITVVESSSGVSGAYSNVATVTATQPDFNQGNNSYTAVGIVQSNVCADPAVLGNGGTLTGVVNTYYPATASVSAGVGNTSIPVGTATGAATTIAAGNLLLVIQMQDASINDTNGPTYGNGYTGSGFTAINNAGNYEYVTASGPMSGSNIPITGAGANGGLVYSYNFAAASGTKGQSTYQVIVVPQYQTATLSSTLTALAWNGSTGGVLALDVAGALTLGSATVVVDGLGFRGGAGLQLTGGTGANTDYVLASPATYTGAAEPGAQASKGEGVAGTPLWVESGGTYLSTGTDGYPNGGMARGAPANAGGGGTDGDPQTASPGGNDQNAGGGGGGNGGVGGSGGNSWSTALGVGGLGGAPFPTTLGRLAMGGGGGAGTRNNLDNDPPNPNPNNLASGGSAGGGIIYIRAGSLTGTATLTANGAASYNLTENDAGGGGGAGGTIVVLSANGGEGGLTLDANGGSGGDAWTQEAFALVNRHGPGGGGGGGVVYVSGPATISVSGGANGITLNPGVAYGATSGATGISVNNAQISQGSGTQSGPGCIPDMTISMSDSGSFLRGTTVGYQVVASNVSPYGSTSGLVVMNDTLPLGIVPSAASGTGWTCTVALQTVSCVRSDVLTAGSSYLPIAITASVSQTAPATVSNTSIIAGGGEINLANDTYTVTANVTSSSDLSVSNIGTPDPVSVGNNITYTQTVMNNGPSDSTGVTFSENIPTNTTLVSVSSPSGWTCSNANNTGTLTCSDPDLTAGSTATFTVVVKVNAGTTNGTIVTDTASVASDVADPNSANNSASVAIAVSAAATGNLSVSSVASPNPVQAGNNISYTQVVVNTGTAAATSATFTEVVPTNTTFQALTYPAGWTCSTPAVGSTGTISCTDPSVAAGSNGTFQVQVQVNSGVTPPSTITDTVTVSPGTAGSNSVTTTDPVASSTQADLALSTTTFPSGQVLSGNNLIYNQTITNNGPAAAAGATFTEAVPTNTTYQSVLAPSGWTCTTPVVGATTGTISCTDASLAAGSAANINVTFNVPASVVNGTTITATSSVSATTSDPNSANNSTTTTTTAAAATDLVVTNTESPALVEVGTNITYAQTLVNAGPSNAANVTFTQVIPANTAFQSFTAPTGWTCNTLAVGSTGGTLTCTIANLAPGTTTFSPVVQVAAGTATGTLITDTATATTTTRNTAPSDGTASVSVAVSAAGDAALTITDSGTPDPVTAGNNITYTQTVTNSGPASATGVSFTEAIPTNTTFQSFTPPTGWTCNTLTVGSAGGTLTCTIATLVTGTTTFSPVVQVVAATASGTLITDTDKVTATNNPNANNTATSSIAVAASADLSITNLGSPNPVQAGSPNLLTYTQKVTNPGPSNAANVIFTEAIPANTNFQSFTPPTGWTCNTLTVGGTGTLTCTIASLAPGVTTFSPVVQVNSGTASGTTIADTASVSSPTDTNPANNSATATTTVATATQADLAMSNTPSASTVTAGSNITYTQTITDNGPASASTLTFTELTPPNTTFQSITPGSWACTTPAVGATGTISCTLATLAAAANAPITVVVQTNATTPQGTVIGDTASVSATTSDPNPANNSATATTTIASSNSADMAITNTPSPSTVAQGNLLTYTLGVTNNGPASATDVTVVDALPSSLTFNSVTTNVGTCSQASNTVTCLLGTMADAATATITIVTTPQSATILTDTATVSADQPDPNPANNSATATTLVTAVTRVELRSLTAETSGQGVVLRWKTGGELNNLGFNVYRDQNGERVRLNSTLVAGSALLMQGYLEKHAGRSYIWIDPAGTPISSYWLEDMDLNGTRTLHGPVTTNATASAATAASSPMLSEFAKVYASHGTPAKTDSASHVVEHTAGLAATTSAQTEQQYELAGHPAVKIMVDHEGWYRVTQPELVAAGLAPDADPAGLRLFAEAIEQPIEVTGATTGHGGFGPNAAIEFYGTAIDTPFSGTRVYWLIAGDQPGLRVDTYSELPANNYRREFPETIELRQRTTYFAALINSTDNNFFGAIISTTPTDQVLNTSHISAAATWTPRIEVVLQGVGEGVPHDVAVVLNGTSLGDISFTGQIQGHGVWKVPADLLQEGANTVTLTAQDGDTDITLVDHITIKYPRMFVTDSDQLQCAVHAGDAIEIDGFRSGDVRVFDVTNGGQPLEVATRIVSSGNSFSVQAQVPWTPLGHHTLLALAGDRIAAPAALRANHPSHWHSPQPGSEVVDIVYPRFAAAIAPLVNLRRQQGHTVSVVRTDDVYDEFSFGEHNPQAIRNFLSTATVNWKTTPQYLLLAGGASIDPRNFLSMGDFDFVPTAIIPTAQLMTASDDWFSDFNDSGFPTMATGRLSVRTADETRGMVAKIVTYETASNSGPWTDEAVIVADRNDNDNFTEDSQSVAKLLPQSLQVSDIFTTNLDPATARAEVLSALNSGGLLVNYLGHGSVEQWSGDDLFDDDSAAALTNAPRLPVFIVMDCLNGFFQDVYTQSLAETLMLNTQGGAVAVVASSGLNNAPPQLRLDRNLVTALFQNNGTLGDALLQAKSTVDVKDVRRTYILFGDPLTRLMTTTSPQ